MNNLIINADDFGITDAVTKGIFESIQNGVVSRTSAMMCSENSKLIKSYASELKGKIGLHLQLTDGKPKLFSNKIPSLVDSSGRFPEKSNQLKRINLKEIELEWNTQMNTLLELGIRPSHIDSHHNVHRFPKAFKAICTIGKKYNLPIRPLSMNMARKLNSLNLLQNTICLEAWPDKKVTISSLINYLLTTFNTYNKTKRPFELMCHPGYVDEELKTRSEYLEQRELELNVLSDPDLPYLLKSNNICVINRINA